MRVSASIAQPVTPPIIIANASWVDLGGPKYIISREKQNQTWRLTRKKEMNTWQLPYDR